MKLILVIGLFSVIFVLGCINTVQLPPRDLASSVKLQASFAYVNNNTPKIVISIISNESVPNATINIKLPKELNESEIKWTGNISKNEPVLIEAGLNENASGNFTIETNLESTEFTGNVTATKSVEVTSSSSTLAPSGGSGGAPWDPCSRPRTYVACVRTGACFTVTEPRKGSNYTSYFSSLNTTDEFIYGMLQFDGCGALPEGWDDTFRSDNITLFDSAGDRAYFFKAPRSTLTAKSYDFVRWAGIVENATLKIPLDLMDDILNKSNESVRFAVLTYEVPTENQYQLILSRVNELPPYSNRSTYMSVIANGSQVLKITEFNFVKEFEKWYPYVKE